MSSHAHYPPGIKSSRKTGSAAVNAGACKLHGWSIATTTAEGNVKLYDHGTAYGPSVHVILPKPVDCANGIYAALAGTGATVVVYYETRPA